MPEGEVWEDVAGYEGLYKVSNKGNVYSVGRVSSQGIKIGGQTLKPSYARGGYFKVGLYKNGTMETKQVHRLVAEAGNSIVVDVLEGIFKQLFKEAHT